MNLTRTTMPQGAATVASAKWNPRDNAVNFNRAQYDAADTVDGYTKAAEQVVERVDRAAGILQHAR